MSLQVSAAVPLHSMQKVGDLAMRVPTHASVPEQNNEHAAAVPQLILVVLPLHAVLPAQRTSHA